jgi:hypothetical protein
MIAKRDLEASMLENMPLVKCIMTTGEWIFMICHPKTMFACAGMKEGCMHMGKPINHFFKGQTIYQCLGG